MQRDTTLQQLSQGCALHTNEGIDVFLHRCVVFYGGLDLCANIPAAFGGEISAQNSELV